MVYVPPPNRGPAKSSDAPQWVAATGGQKKNRRGGKRGHGSITRDIQTKARARQAAWSEGGQPNETYRLTRELNGPEEKLAPEGLYAEHRQAQAGTFADPYRGSTWRPV